MEFQLQFPPVGLAPSQWNLADTLLAQSFHSHNPVRQTESNMSDEHAIEKEYKILYVIFNILYSYIKYISKVAVLVK